MLLGVKHEVALWLPTSIRSQQHSTAGLLNGCWEGGGLFSWGNGVRCLSGDLLITSEWIEEVFC